MSAMQIVSALSDQLLVGAHSRAALISGGVTETELRGPLWRRVSYGMYAWAAHEPQWVDTLRRLGALVPPGGAIGGWAAAHLHGAVDLDGITALGRILPVLICTPRHGTCRRGEGTAVCRSDLAPGDVTVIDRIPVTSLLRTGYDLSRLSACTGTAGHTPSDAEEAVVLLDALLRTGSTTRDELASYATGLPRRAGFRQSREVLAAVCGNTRSCQETRFRLLWTNAAGLPQPLVNQALGDREGRFVAEVDLFDREAALVGEYDGGHHSGAHRRSADNVRIETLESLGLAVVRVASPDLDLYRARTVHRLRSSYSHGLARTRTRDAWTLLHVQAPPSG